MTGWKLLGCPIILVGIGLSRSAHIDGPGPNGNQNWLRLGRFNVQPSEGTKLALVVSGGPVLAAQAEALSTPSSTSSCPTSCRARPHHRAVGSDTTSARA